MASNFTANPALHHLPTPTFTTLTSILDSIEPRGLYSNLLVTGCARSGTKYASRAIEYDTGAVCRHEASPFSLQACSSRNYRDHFWGHVAPNMKMQRDVSWLAAPLFTGSPLPKHFSKWCVVHLVRHPLACIESIVRRGFLWRGRYHEVNPYGLYACKHMEANPLPPIDGAPSRYTSRASMVGTAAIYWLTWNYMLMRNGYPVLAIENLTVDHTHPISPTENGGGVGDLWPRYRISSLEDLPDWIRADVKCMGEMLGYGF